MVILWKSPFSYGFSYENNHFRTGFPMKITIFPWFSYENHHFKHHLMIPGASRALRSCSAMCCAWFRCVQLKTSAAEDVEDLRIFETPLHTCLCINTYIYIHICLFINIYIYIYIYTYMSIHKYTYIFIYMCVCACKYMYLYIHIYICMYIFTYVCIYVSYLITA